jgi:hypothetical protein
MARVSSSGQMEQAMKAIGETEWLMGGELFIMLTKISILESFSRTEPMAMELIFMRTARDMRVCGKMTNRMERAWKS